MTTPADSHRAVRFASGNGVALSAQHWGEPGHPLLILLHGGGANGHWWSPIAPLLAGRFHLVALDFRGHGDSDHPEDLEVGAFHRDVESLVAHLGSSKCFLAGHSLGAHVALDHAARHPEIRGVVAIEAGRGAQRRDSRRARLALAARRSYRTREEAIARYRFLPASPGAPEALRRHIAERSVQRQANGRFAYNFDPRWFRIPAATPAPLADIACPTLLVRGADSTLLTAEGAAALAAELRDARILEIPGAGHNVHLERPGPVGRAMSAHLEHCERSSA